MLPWSIGLMGQKHPLHSELSGVWGKSSEVAVIMYFWAGLGRQGRHSIWCCVLPRKLEERNIRELQKKWEVQQMETAKLQNVKRRGLWGLKKKKKTAGKNTGHSDGAQTSELAANINFKDVGATLNNMRITVRYHMSSRSVESCPFISCKLGTCWRTLQLYSLLVSSNFLTL